MLSCIVCDRELQLAFSQDSEEKSRQCNDAVMFSSSGNYGSTLWDNFDSELELLVNICDECLVRKKNQVSLVTIKRELPVVTYGEWDPEAERL